MGGLAATVGVALLSSGAVAYVAQDAATRIGDPHKRVLSPCEHGSRRNGRRESSLRLAAETYATAPS
jgi:hypothetical protein